MPPHRRFSGNRRRFSRTREDAESAEIGTSACDTLDRSRASVCVRARASTLIPSNDIQPSPRMPGLRRSSTRSYLAAA